MKILAPYIRPDLLDPSLEVLIFASRPLILTTKRIIHVGDLEAKIHLKKMYFLVRLLIDDQAVQMYLLINHVFSYITKYIAEVKYKKSR